MAKDFPSIAERMGKDDGGNVNAEQPPAVLVTLADEQCAQAERAARMALLAMADLSPRQRWTVAQSFSEVLNEAERLGMEEVEAEF